MDLARVIRSKNAGNHFFTFDIFFGDDATYQWAKASGVFTRERIAELYAVPPERITKVVEYDPGHAFKIVMRRPIVSGGVGETDVYGSQQYIPLLTLAVPWK